jgi:hypothetical protein
MVFLARDGQQLGCFPREEVREGIRAGRFLPTDLFFVEGMAEWRPLAEWQVAATPSPKRSLAIPALLGCGALLVLVALLAGAGLLWRGRQRAQSQQPFPQALALFRIGMLHDWEATVHRFAEEPMERQFADWSVAVWAPVAPDVGWSYWFDTAVFTGVELASQRPRTAFYHPWSDTVWLAEWSRGEKPRLVRGWFGAGDVLRSQGRPPWEATPLWLRGHGPRADALAAALSQSVAAAERALRSGAWPDTATSREPLRRTNTSLCRLPLLELLVGLQPLRVPVRGEQLALTALRRELQELRLARPQAVLTRLQEAPDTTAEMRAALRALPPALATALQPVCRVGKGGTVMVVLMPSRSADVALGTVWEVRGNGVRLRRVDVLPFAQLLAAAGASQGARS